ncbi:Hypothetical_protein [Hexamita inflata]|uniref:Hypothetical_protein n=1 Tax=Hexamita inflata TaxID=28002 RepID=A0AA86UXZ8_9EUKA|nr:Hypothetical protein HINF_LOCUS56656 [Hexamita inflata]
MKTQVNFIKTQVDFIKNQDCHVQTFETRYLAYKLLVLKEIESLYAILPGSIRECIQESFSEILPYCYYLIFSSHSVFVAHSITMYIVNAQISFAQWSKYELYGKVSQVDQVRVSRIVLEKMNSLFVILCGFQIL